MLGKNIMVGGFLVLVLAVILPVFHTLDLQALYEKQCQMTCMEYDVDKLRTDFWDWRFLRFLFCSLGNVPDCSYPYRLETNMQARTCRLFRQNSRNVEESFEMPFPTQEEVQKLRDLKKRVDFYKIVEYLSFLTWDSKTHHFKLEHRSARFRYNDFLDLGLKRIETKGTSIHAASKLPVELEEKLWNIVILMSVAMNNETEKQINNEGLTDQKPYMISIGTNVFDQNTVIFTDGSKYYSWFSTLVCIWSLLIIFYFVWKMLISLHGFTEKIAVRRGHYVTRPDLIAVGTGDLSLFRSYFYSTVFAGQGFCRAIVFLYCFIIWFLSIIAYFNLSPMLVSLNKTVCILLFIICSVSSLLLIPEAVVFLLCFSLIIFTPELLIPIKTYLYHTPEQKTLFYMLTKYVLSNYQLYFILLLSTCSIALIVLFYFHNCLLDLMLNRDLVHSLLWPSWPVQVIVYLTKAVRKFYALPDTALHMIWFLLVSILFYLGIFKVPQYVGERELSNDPKYLHVLGYWLFFPVYFILVTFCNYYKKFISLAIEAVFTTLFITFLCIFLLPWLYPSLKLLKDKYLVLYAILTLTLVTYLLKIYREWYGIYDRYLKDVVLYVRNRYSCEDNNADLDGEEDSIALVCNHIDKGTCQHLIENQGHVNGSRYRIKGLLILMKNSRIYVPSDFFFGVIKMPGAPGAIKRVVAKELLTLVLLRLFPAVYIYWLCHVIYLTDFESYSLVITAVLGASFVNQYKELFLHRNTSVVDVNGNTAFQREINKFLRSFESWYFVSPA